MVFSSNLVQFNKNHPDKKKKTLLIPIDPHPRFNNSFKKTKKCKNCNNQYHKINITGKKKKKKKKKIFFSEDEFYSHMAIIAHAAAAAILSKS